MLKDNVIAITGGAGLIGSALSRSIIINRGSVVIGDISVDRGKRLQTELGADNAIFCRLDTSDPESVNDLIDVGKSNFGKIDSAVHCAYPRSKQWGTRFEDIKPEPLKEDLYSQLGGAIMFSQKMISYFEGRGRGNLIHIASIQGLSAPKFEHYENTSMGSPIEYGAIKSGIISITRYLAKYCKHKNIRVNCVSPGGILDNQPQIFLEKYKKSCCNKGMLDASDIVGSIIYLLSPMSQYVTGHNIIVDDGWSL